MPTYICAYLCMYMYVQLHIYTFMQICVHTRVNICMHKSMYTCMHTYLHKYIHAYIRTYIRLATYEFYSFIGPLGKQQLLTGPSGQIFISCVQRPTISIWLALWASLGLFTVIGCLNSVVAFGHKNGRIS